MKLEGRGHGVKLTFTDFNLKIKNYSRVLISIFELKSVNDKTCHICRKGLVTRNTHVKINHSSKVISNGYRITD